MTDLGPFFPSSDFGLTGHGIERGSQSRTLSTGWIQGPIINSITEHKDKLKRWQHRIVSVVQQARRGIVWDSSDRYAVTLQFRFHHDYHGWKRDDRGDAVLDVENFIKPVLDGLAAGLFSDDDPAQIPRFDYDDSNFKTLLIHRHPDPEEKDDEGVRIFVSAIKQS